MKLKYTDEATFITEELEFTDEHYQITEDLHKTFGNFGPIIIRKDKKSLCFGIDKSTNRVDREVGNNVYRITIEKINNK